MGLQIYNQPQVINTLIATNISSPSLSGVHYGDGAPLTDLNATNISQGTLNNSRLPAVATFTTSISSPSVSGDGANLTGLNATNISQGTLNNSRLPAVATFATSVSSITVSGIFYGDGSNLSNLDAGDIIQGTLNNSRLPAVATFTTSVSSPALSGNHYGDGSALTNLNATNIASGTLNNSRLPAIATFTTSVSSPALSGNHYGDGSKLTGVVLSTGGTITGDLNITGNLSALGTTTQIDTMVFVTSAVSVTNTGTGPALYVKQTGSNDVASFYDDTTSALIIKDGGNVGIGDSSPGSKLSVYSSSDTQPAVTITQLGTANALIIEDSTSPDNTPFVIDADGNVLIGLSATYASPFNYPFQISRAGTSGATFARFTNSTSSAGLRFAKSRGSTNGTFSGGLSSGDNIGVIDYYGDNGALSATRTAWIANEADGLFTASSAPSRFTIATTASGSTTPVERLRIDNVGNVGIGDTSPNSKLSVYSTSNTEAAVTINQTGTGNAFVVEDSTSPDSTPFVIDADGNVIVGGLSAYNDSTTTASNSRMQLQVVRQGNISSRMGMWTFSTQVGDRGIFSFNKSAATTTGIASAVSINEDIGSIDFNGYDKAVVPVLQRAAMILGEVDGVPLSGSVPGRISFLTTSSGSDDVTEKMRITNDGKVGIGTEAPGEKLTVAGNISAQGNISSTFYGSNGFVKDALNPGISSFKSSNSRFDLPSQAAFDSSGNLYISSNRAIRKITPAGVVSTFAGSPGQSGTSNGTGTAARFNTPTGMAFDSSGNLFVADFGNNNIRKISPAGVVSSFAGSTAGLSGSTNNSTGSSARFYGPIGVAIDSSNNLFVADSVNNTIRKITAAGAVTTFAGIVGSTGSTDGAGTVATFWEPHGITIDSSNTLYVADRNNAKIRKITSGALVSTLATLALAMEIDIDSSGNLFVSNNDNHVIYKVTPTGTSSVFAGTLDSPGSTDGSSGTQFYGPLGVAVDRYDNVFISDQFNHTIRRITSAGVVSTVAGETGTEDTVDDAFPSVTYYTDRVILDNNANRVNVGIGSSTPNERLTVVGNISSTGGVYSKGFISNRADSTQEGGQIDFNRSYDNAKSFSVDVYSDVAGSQQSRLRFVDAIAGVERMTMLSGGNVGIGTAFPNKPLTVVGDISASGIVYGNYGVGSNLTVTSNVSAGGSLYGDGRNLTFTPYSNTTLATTKLSGFLYNGTDYYDYSLIVPKIGSNKIDIAYNSAILSGLSNTLSGGGSNGLFGPAMPYDQWYYNYKSSYSTIVGGYNNRIITSSYSSILGGQNNSIVGPAISNAFVIGSNITAQYSDAVHVNNVISYGSLIGNQVQTGTLISFTDNTNLMTVPRVRASLNFDGIPKTAKTYTRSTTTITVTFASHGYSSGMIAEITAATDTGVNGVGKVITVIDANTFSFTTTAVGANGTLTIRSMIKSSYNVSSITSNAVGDYTVTFSTVLPDAYYIPSLSFIHNSTANDNANVAVYSLGTMLAGSCRIFCARQTTNTGTTNDTDYALCGTFTR